jgi:hypothetical protein
VCDQPSWEVAINTCSQSGKSGDVRATLIATECAVWTRPRPIQIQIKTDSGGDVVATVALIVGYNFDTSSGLAMYNSNDGSLVLNVQANTTLGPQASSDPFAFAFCIKATNPMQTVNGAKLQVSANVGTPAVSLQSLYVPGIQVSVKREILNLWPCIKTKTLCT